MDAIAPALIGLGLFLMYEAYKNPSPSPLQKALTAIKANSIQPGAPSQPGQIGYGASLVPVNQTTGVAQ